MDRILNLYKSKYKFESFYDIVSNKISKNDLISDNYFFEAKIPYLESTTLKANPNDIRVDLPVWFGNTNNVKLKIMILGREPRDSHDKYNLEINKQHKYIFGSPFGIELWSSKNKYFRSFKTLIENNQILCYFSDVVKTYEVKSTKSESDLFAKKNFWIQAEKDQTNLTFLKQEIQLLNPHIIIGLGIDSYIFLCKHFGGKYQIEKVIHPNARKDKRTNQNAWEIADIQIKNIINSFFKKLS